MSRTLPPHPGPLPRGERLQIERLRFSRDWGNKSPSPRTSGVRENGPPQPSPPEEEREMRSRCLERAINRSLLTEFAAVRAFKVRNFISAKSLPEGEGRGEGEATVETRQ